MLCARVAVVQTGIRIGVDYAASCVPTIHCYISMFAGRLLEKVVASFVRAGLSCQLASGVT